MPIYEYICLKCNNTFSVLQKISASEKDTVCSRCGSSNVRKMMSAFSSSSAGGAGSSLPSFSGYSGGG